jgi:hypothetical protein
VIMVGSRKYDKQSPARPPDENHLILNSIGPFEPLSCPPVLDQLDEGVLFPGKRHGP